MTEIAKVDAETNPLGRDRSDPSGADDVTTINPLHLPAHTPLIVKLRSKDVIHGFSLPGSGSARMSRAGTEEFRPGPTLLTLVLSKV